MTGMNLRVAVVPLVRANMWTLRVGSRALMSPFVTRLHVGLDVFVGRDREVLAEVGERS